ncbi:MAG: hypothetical protein HFI53_13685 [Lachnospiraceae bacterium]|nr:hypothetical protein [Lachnospiraceae bacterium]
MHIAVCDDNIADRKQMERLLGRASDRRLHTTGVLYIDSYGNVEAVMRSPMLYDAFFIDMTSGPVNGFQLARKLIDAGVTAPIVLCISTIDYPSVIEAAIAKVPEDVSETSNHDILRRQLQKQILYLQKPIKVKELDEMLDHAQNLKSQTVPTIELRGEKDTLYVYEDEILYAIKDGNYVHVVLTENRSLDVLSTIHNLYTQVTMFTHFLPVSEHCFVNVTFIDRLSLLKLTMKDGKSFNVSPLELSRLKKALQKKTT